MLAENFAWKALKRINWSELNVTLVTVAEGEEEPAVLQVGFTQPSEVQEDGSFEIKDAPGGNLSISGRRTFGEISRLLYEIRTAGWT